MRGRSRLRPRTPAVSAAPIAPARLNDGCAEGEGAEQDGQGARGQGEQHRDRHCGDEQREPGEEPVGGDPPRRDEGGRMGAQQELVEGAVLEVLPEETVEREEGSEQGRDPERPGADGGEGGRTDSGPEGKYARHDDEEDHRGRPPPTGAGARNARPGERRRRTPRPRTQAPPRRSSRIRPEARSSG